MASETLPVYRGWIPSFMKRGGDEIDYWTRIGLLIVALTFGGTLLWSSLAPLSSAVIASGLVKVDSSRKKIQHPEGGIVREILIRDGAVVKAGDPLIRLDKTRADASHGVLQSGYDAALAYQSRLQSERDNLATISFAPELLARRDDPKVAELIDSQITQFNARRTSLTGQLSILQKQVVYLQRGIEGLSAQARAKEEQLQSLKKEIAGYSELLAKGMVEKTRIWNIEREISRLSGEKAEHLSDIDKSRASISEKELEMFQLRKAFREDVVEQLRKAQSEINDYTERLGAAQQTVEQTEIKSPVDGTVVDVKVHTAGGVVGPGEVLMEVVPINDRLVIEAKVRPEDIDRVHVGLNAGIKLAAFDQRALDELNGRVTYVSADAIEDAKLGLFYFLIRLEVTDEELKRYKDKLIQPGMMADVFVRTGERTFLNYLFHPLVQSFNAAWRER
jgi:HlyD family type I secretion membrane fusion protein